MEPGSNVETYGKKMEHDGGTLASVLTKHRRRSHVALRAPRSEQVGRLSERMDVDILFLHAMLKES
jgi:hypothetical protein